MWALTALLSFIAAATCFQLDHLHMFDEHLARRQSTTTNSSRTPVFNISLPIDHFNKSDTRRFNNQYWVNDTWYRPGGPIFLFDAGESGVTNQLVNLYLANDSSSTIALAKKYHGLAILWEHRYYGGSLPFPINSSGGVSAGANEAVGAPASYKYLTVEQALEDVVYFANHLNEGGYKANDLNLLHPSKTPWVWVGGSYPGIRGTFMRIRNPEIIYAVWASSPPTEAIYSGASYLSPIARSLPRNCSTDVQAIIKHVDQVLAGPHSAQEYRDIQNFTYVAQLAAASVGFNRTFNYSLALGYDSYSIAQVMRNGFVSFYQSYGPSLVTHTFCNYLESYNPGVPGNVANNTILSILSNPGNAPPNPQGLLTAHNNNLTIGVHAYFYAYIRNYQHIYKDIRTAAGIAGALGEIENVDYNLDAPVNTFADQNSWVWQVNTEFGWFQAYDPTYDTPGNHIISRFLNVTSYQQYQRRIQFNNATIAALPARPNVEAFNKYGGWNMTPSNVMFTDGDADPWRAGSVFSEETELGAPNRKPTTVVPQCGQAPPDGQVYGALYPGAAHVWDLRKLAWVGGKNGVGLYPDGRTPQEVGLELFGKALDVWLPCFNGTK